MAGLLVLGIAGLWLFIAVKVTGWVARGIGRNRMSRMAGFAAFPVVILAPFADEAIGMWQFNRLCTNEAVVWTHSDASKVEAARRGPGKVIRERDGLVVPVTEQVAEYVDVATGQPFLRVHAFHTPGGFVMRAGLNMGHRRACWPDGWTEAFKKVNLDELLRRGGT